MTRRNFGIGVIFVTLLGGLWIGSALLEKKATVEAAGVQAPRFGVDPMWPKPLPNHWIMGNTIGVSVDSKDHIWIIHRAGSLEAKEVYATTNPPGSECCTPAPAVLEFDEEGNLLGHWGGADGPGYEWPASNHGITVDYKGNVWIGGNGRAATPAPGTAPAAAENTASAPAFASADQVKQAKQAAKGKAAPGRGGPPLYHDSMVLKFTQEGKFLMRIGKTGASQGSNDTENLGLPAKIFVDAKTNELYVADGYGNKRVIVFDADSGKYKRHWGAYGHKPDDTNLGPYRPDAPVAQQFRNPVHCAELSVDGLLYVCDRVNDRIQVFKPDGTFVKETFIAKNTLGDGSVWDIAFSKDPQQKFMYLVDGANEKIYVMQRDSLEILTSFGDGGRQPGQFYAVHSI
ncbi:MAG TPA: hypothetical protein VE958_03655, partial [Bryobacteraceae bacterium]|nr:hypothetical protein [Bryobacteraceae bacterium]